MVDLTQKPYFCYDDAIKAISQPIRALADVRLIGYSRVFRNRERFLICTYKEWCVDFYTERQLYRYGLYEQAPHELPSAYHMWDHMPYAPPEIYLHSRKTFNIAHGLTIIKQHGDYCDSFVFVTHPGNNQVNNFYLNQKELFESFIQDFYMKMAPTIGDLSSQRIIMPTDIQFVTNSILTLSPRQRDCALLLAEGSRTKEIAGKLHLSPRTIEGHINSLRAKFGAKNRLQLVGSLREVL
jgi:DNA-binding CsgD family transcriptional regulator